MALSTTVGLNVNANLTSTLNVGTANANLANGQAMNLISGVLAGQADTAWWDHRTLAASASENLNLVGTLLSPFGAAVTFARIKLLMVTADATNTNNVAVGGAASNAVPSLFGATTNTAIVRPGASLAWIAGIADATGYIVTPTTGMQLQVANSGSGTSVSYTVVVIGAST